MKKLKDLKNLISLTKLETKEKKGFLKNKKDVRCNQDLLSKF